MLQCLFRVGPLASLLLFLTASSVGSIQAGVLSPGDTMPLVGSELSHVDGRQVSLDSFRGDAGTLVIFSCNSCPVAQSWEQRIVDLGHRYLERGVITVLINSNDPQLDPEEGFDQLQAAARRLEIKFPYLADEAAKVARAFNATRTPEAFLFDGGSRLVYHGAIDDNADDPAGVGRYYLQEALDAMLAREQVGIPDTPVVGCPIRFRP